MYVHAFPVDVLEDGNTYISQDILHFSIFFLLSNKLQLQFELHIVWKALSLYLQANHTKLEWLQLLLSVICNLTAVHLFIINWHWYSVTSYNYLVLK